MGRRRFDIKPYVSALDVRDAERTGWYANVVDGAANVRADERFNR
ncbi:MAG: hypothetical protein U0841_29815 [Chloroflexia bacterium]